MPIFQFLLKKSLNVGWSHLCFTCMCICVWFRPSNVDRPSASSGGFGESGLVERSVRSVSIVHKDKVMTALWACGRVFGWATHLSKRDRWMLSSNHSVSSICIITPAGVSSVVCDHPSCDMSQQTECILKWQTYSAYADLDVWQSACL